MPLPEGFSSYSTAKERFLELREKSYMINDAVGAYGIEKTYEEALRGSIGRRYYFADAKGNELRKMPGITMPISGKRVITSLSIELQQFVEQMLIQSEMDRNDFILDVQKIGGVQNKMPWVRGAAAVVIDPKNGEVLSSCKLSSI